MVLNGTHTTTLDAQPHQIGGGAKLEFKAINERVKYMLATKTLNEGTFQLKEDDNF